MPAPDAFDGASGASAPDFEYLRQVWVRLIKRGTVIRRATVEGIADNINIPGLFATSDWEEHDRKTFGLLSVAVTLSVDHLYIRDDTLIAMRDRAFESFGVSLAAVEAFVLMYGYDSVDVTALTAEQVSTAFAFVESVGSHLPWSMVQESIYNDIDTSLVASMRKDVPYV
jgi:hypothetical protein